MQKVKKLLAAFSLICLFVVASTQDSFATWYVIYDNDSGDYDAYYVDDGIDQAVWMEY